MIDSYPIDWTPNEPLYDLAASGGATEIIFYANDGEAVTFSTDGTIKTGPGFKKSKDAKEFLDAIGKAFPEWKQSIKCSTEGLKK